MCVCVGVCSRVRACSRGVYAPVMGMLLGSACSRGVRATGRVCFRVVGSSFTTACWITLGVYVCRVNEKSVTRTSCLVELEHNLKPLLRIETTLSLQKSHIISWELSIFISTPNNQEQRQHGIRRQYDS